MIIHHIIIFENITNPPLIFKHLIVCDIYQNKRYVIKENKKIYIKKDRSIIISDIMIFVK